MSTATIPTASFSLTNGEAMAALERGDMIPWEGTIVIEGIPSGDSRTIELGALTWRDLPLPLMAMFENPVGGDGHDGAMLAGRIDAIERRDGGELFASGFIDPTSPGGPTLVKALDHSLMRGVSVDLDSVQFVDGGSRGAGKRVITSGRVSGATATPFQAFMEATIGLSIAQDTTEAMAAAGTTRVTAKVWTPIDPLAALVASGGIPVAPPAEWFAKPAFDKLTPLTITPSGRVFGHVAAFGTCHIAFGRCTPVPRSNTNYAGFRNGHVLTAEGTIVRTGPLVMDTVHPDLQKMASDAQAFYADTGCAVADVVPYEDQFGILIAGAVRPTATPEQIRALRGSDISPDWRTINGYRRECCAMLAVNNSGFKVPQTLVASAGTMFVEPGEARAFIGDDGEVLALVASAATITETAMDETEDCGCAPADDGDKKKKKDDAMAAIRAAFAPPATPSRQFGKRKFDETKISRGGDGKFFGPGSGGKGHGSPAPKHGPTARPGADVIQEDDAPMNSPHGGKLKDFNRGPDGKGPGVAVYSDGAVYDGKGWQSKGTPSKRRFGAKS